MGNNYERNATIITNEPCVFLCFHREDYEQFAPKQSSCELLARSTYIKKHPLFKSWPVSYRNILVENVQFKTVRFGESVVVQGDSVHSVFFVISGQAKLTMKPKAHYQQFPKLMKFDDVTSDSEEEENDEEDYISNRFKQLSVLNQRKVKRDSGFYTAELLRRDISICTIGPNGLIGDLEAILDLQQFTVTAECIEEMTLYEVDKYSFMRVIVRKNPETYERMRKIVKDKVTFRNDSITGGVPIYRSILNSYKKLKPRNERERLLQLYGRAKAQRRPTDFQGLYDRLKRRPTILVSVCALQCMINVSSPIY